MQHFLNPDLNTIDWNQVSQLIDKVGWTDRDPEEMKQAFSKSSYTVFVFEGDQLIAMGRSVDDGRYYAILADIIVDPDHQGKQLGDIVVNTLTEQLKDFNFVTLTSSTYKADRFYKRLGFKKQSSAFIWPMSEKQMRQHAEPEEDLIEATPEKNISEVTLEEILEVAVA
jgi:aralkylamine N-acetyltransferase